MPGGMLSVINMYLNTSLLKDIAQRHIVSASKTYKKWTFLKSVIEYLFLCFKGEVALAHIHMSERGSCKRALFFIGISRWFSVPIIVHSHGGEVEETYRNMGSMYRSFFVTSMKKVDKVLVLTNGWKAFWSQIVPIERIEVIPNAIKLPQIGEKKYFNAGQLNLLYLGYISELKGTYDLIEALNFVQKTGIKVHLVIGGNGEINTCKQLVKRFSLQKVVSVEGWMDEVEKDKALRKADVLVLPSHYESFGIVLLEALSYKVPVICGDGGFSKEIVKDRVDGYVVHSGNSADIGQKIIKLSSLKVLTEFGNAGFKDVSMKYSEEKIVLKLRSIYEKLKK